MVTGILMVFGPKDGQSWELSGGGFKVVVNPQAPPLKLAKVLP